MEVKDMKVEIKTKQIGVPMPEDMAEKFERLCRARGQTMSGIVKVLVWEWMNEQIKSDRAEGE